MTVKATLDAALPEATRIAHLAEIAFGEDGVTIALSERTAHEWRVELYFEETAPEVVEARVRDRFGTDAFGASLQVEALPATDWVLEGLSALPPIMAGRFIVHGSHDREHVPPGRIAIEIDAGLAFGTGHHGTTLGCLEALDAELKRCRPRRVLDLGTGSGVLAIACARAARALVIASDIDPTAVAVARENARRAGVGDLVRTVASDGVRARLVRESAPYDLVLANILAGPLMALAPRLAPLLSPGGAIILSGLLPRQRERVTAAYRAQGIRLSQAVERDGWMILTMRKPARRAGSSKP